MKRFFLILFPIFFIGFFRPSYLIPIQNKNKNLFKISKKEYLNSFFKILKANYIKLLVFSYFGYDTTEVIDQSINKYKKIIKPLKILSKSNQILFLIKIIQTYNSILLKNIPACYEQIKRNKNIDQNFILTFPEKQEIKDEFEKSIYKYYKIIYIHGGGH